MKKISFEEIKNMNIDPLNFVNWVKEAFLNKYDCVLPHKISMKYYGDGFVNVMPSIIPSEGVYGVKVVSRNPNSEPTLKGDIFLFDIETNDLIATLDGTYITALRTGAVAALSTITLAKSDYESIALIGLGNVGRAYIKCLLPLIEDKNITLKLKKHHNQEQDIINYLKDYPNIKIELFDDMESFIKDSDVIVSSITVANDLLAEESWFKKGCTLIPVHTRGFQNCDEPFDMVVCDDYSHVEGFKNYDKFHNCTELSKILRNESAGRINDEQRILVYNIGISLHDVVIANKIIKSINYQVDNEEKVSTDKYWVF